MTNLLYAFLFLISGIGSFIIAGVAWNRRPMAGAASLAVVMFSMVVWAWASAAYWLTPDVQVKLFLLKFVFVGMVVSSPAFVVMTLKFTRRADWLTHRVYFALSVLPAIALVLLWTDDWFSLHYIGNDIFELEKTLRAGFGFRLVVLNGYLDTAFAFGLLIKDLFQESYSRRSQIGVILIGSAIPMAPNILSLSNPLFFNGLDLIPLTFTLSGIFYIFGLFRLGVMDLAPMGRNAVFEEMEDAVLVVDIFGRVIDLNPMAKNFVNIEIERPVGKPMEEVFSSWMKYSGLNNKMQTRLYREEVEGPDLYYYDISVTPLLGKTGEIVGHTFVWHDISKQKETEVELRKANMKLNQQLEEVNRLHLQLKELAIRDGLTGIFNRGYMEETLAREIARASRENVPLSTVMIDIDNFKMVNDTYGHSAGDEVLRELGNLLKKNIRKGDFACRYGGDEMLLIMPNTGVEFAVRRAKDIGLLFSEQIFKFGGALYKTTLSIGVASFPEDAETIDQLLHVADKSLYSSKAERKPVDGSYDPLSQDVDSEQIV